VADIVLAAINAKWIHPSWGLRLLKANLGVLETRCEILEFALRQNPEEQRASILNARPKILGISVSVWNHRASLALLESLEREWERSGQRPAVILGGPEVSCLPENGADGYAPAGHPEIFAYADFVIQGEGEKVFAELCETLLRENKHHTRPAEPRRIIAENVNLNTIEPAYRLYTDTDLTSKLIYVESSRDCPFRCAFCHSAISHSKRPPDGKSIREFPLDKFLDNMEQLVNRIYSAANKKNRTIKFLDRSFNVNIPRALAIMEFFLARLKPLPGTEMSNCGHSSAAAPVREEQGETKQTEQTLVLHFEMVPSLFPPALTASIARFPPGSLRLELGIQTLNPEVSAIIKRPSYPERELENLRFLRTKTNAIVHADLIAGLPGESLSSFGEGFDRLWAAASSGAVRGVPFEIQPGILKGLPGTPLRLLSGFGMVYSPDPPYEVIETSAMDREELDRIKNFARFWELLVNRPCGHLRSIIAPPGQSVFRRFLELSDRLFLHFGRNWGIDRKELLAAAQNFWE
jgi:radical SAM superfamily enzyme YgiQ (UPF0313 family)